MKNLLPLTRKISYWDNIVNNKDLINRIPLQAIRPNVLIRFQEYGRYAVPNILERIPSSTFGVPNIDLLARCYSNSTELSLLKVKIHEKQDVQVRSECQYCNINEPNTMDHYLPQNYFPEFAALSINLIPCCSVCNTAKGREWLIFGVRKTIHFYYDPMPNVQYLNCRIRYRHGVPYAVFSIDPAVIPVAIRQVIVNHFHSLDLNKRYQKRSNSEIMAIFDAITQNAGAFSRIRIQTNLLNEATSMQRRLGINYWRAVIKIAVANSLQFLATAGF